MATDPRAALDRLVAALEAHLAAVARDRTDDSAAVVSATGTLIDAFETYDEAIYDTYGVDTPFVVYDDSEDEEEFEDEDFADDDEDDDEDDEGDDEDDDDDDDDEDDEDDEDDDVPPPAPRRR